MKASELIEVLEHLIKTVGDREVYLPAYDYPEECEGAKLSVTDHAYIPVNSIKLY